MTLDQLSRNPATSCADIAAKVAEILDAPENHAWSEVFLAQQLRRVAGLRLKYIGIVQDTPEGPHDPVDAEEDINRENAT